MPKSLEERVADLEKRFSEGRRLESIEEYEARRKWEHQNSGLGFARTGVACPDCGEELAKPVMQGGMIGELNETRVFCRNMNCKWSGTVLD